MEAETEQVGERSITEFIISAVPYGIVAFFIGIIPIAFDDAAIWDAERSFNDLIITHVIHHLFVTANSSLPSIHGTNLIDHMGVYAIPYTFVFGYPIILVGFYYSRKELSGPIASKELSAKVGGSIMGGYTTSMVLSSQFFVATVPGGGPYADVLISADTATAAIAGIVIAGGYGAIGGIIGKSIPEESGDKLLGMLGVFWLLVFYFI